MKAEPKREVGGNSFTWGRNEAIQASPAANDPEDPLYEDDRYVLEEMRPQPVEPQRSSAFIQSKELKNIENWVFDLTELKKETRTRLEDTFNRENYQDFVQWVQDEIPQKQYSCLLARILQITAEKQEKQHNQSWGIIELLYNAKIINSTQLRRGFDRLYNDMQELLIDSPTAPEVILYFLHSAISYEMLKVRHILRVPIDFYNLGRGTFILRDIIDDDVVIGDLLDDLQKVKQSIISLLSEFYASGISDDIIHFLSSGINRHYAPLVIRKAIELGMERPNKERELCSKLIAEISIKADPDAYIEAFDDLLWKVHEWRIDIPGAEKLLAKFCGRAIIDECLPANYIQKCELMAISERSFELETIQSTITLLSKQECYTLMLSVWGPRVEELQDLKNHLHTILIELFDSKEVPNAMECVKELGCPNYLHEFVKKGIEMSMDRHESYEDLLVQLLNQLRVHGLLGESQLNLGLQRLRQKLEDLKLDVPMAGEIFQRVCGKLGVDDKQPVS